MLSLTSVKTVCSACLFDGGSPGLITDWYWQPDRVMEFCSNNDLQLIVRAHECVMDGFERFAQGHLITLFSATNYCGNYLTPLCLPIHDHFGSFPFEIGCFHMQGRQIMLEQY